MAPDQSGKTAILYRMVMPDHLCPYGLKSITFAKSDIPTPSLRWPERASAEALAPLRRSPFCSSQSTRMNIRLLEMTHCRRRA